MNFSINVYGKESVCSVVRNSMNLVANGLSSFYLSSLKEQYIAQSCDLRQFNSTPHLRKSSLVVVPQGKDQTVLALVKGMRPCSKAVWSNSGPNITCLVFWREKNPSLYPLHMRAAIEALEQLAVMWPAQSWRRAEPKESGRLESAILVIIFWTFGSNQAWCCTSGIFR